MQDEVCALWGAPRWLAGMDSTGEGNRFRTSLVGRVKLNQVNGSVDGEVSVRRRVRQTEGCVGVYGLDCPMNWMWVRGRDGPCGCGNRLVPAAGVAEEMSCTFREARGRGNREQVCDGCATDCLTTAAIGPTVCRF